MSTYTLHHGDCLEIMPTLEASSVDAVICDPPYGTTACKWDSVIPFAPMWEQIKRLLKPRGACVLFGSQPFTSALVMSNPAWFRYEWVWHKNKGANFGSVRTRPMKEHENILVFSRDTHKYIPQRQDRTPSGFSRTRYLINHYANGTIYSGKHTPTRKMLTIDRVPSSVQKFNTEVGLHPTQKPLALLEYLVKTYTDEGETVLDFTMGSGTTGHACMNLGRRFIGIEQDAAYFARARERIADAADPLRHMAAQEVPQ
jgi:site-specific DNA-methyltransferase (adenine-specific)